MEFCLIYVPAVSGTSILNYLIIRNLLDSRQMTQQGSEAVRRMTKAFSALCFSWVLTSLPYKVVTLMKQLSFRLDYRGHNDLGSSMLLADSETMNLELMDVSFYFIYMTYSFINSIILILLISNFRKPFERLAKLLCKVRCVVKLKGARNWVN